MPARPLVLAACLALAPPAAAVAQDQAPDRTEAPATLSDNAASVAVVVGNRDYRQTVPVDYAHNDARAMEAYLTGTLGFREENVFVLLDGTLSEFNQMFGSRERPQSGRLWRSVAEASNVFVYFSGHGVPDLTTGEPFLLPADGDPNSSDSGYRLETLYRNLEAVEEKLGDGRRVFVMIDACFTGETGRGESLLAVSAPGFVPARPREGGGLVKLVATSGAAPANWDEELELGLFTSRFLMGAAGLAEPADDGEPGLRWDELQAYLESSVPAEALRETGRAQVPEIDDAALSLPVAAPVPAVAEGVAEARDAAAWERAQGDREALELYVASCGETCAHRDEAMTLLLQGDRDADAAADRAEWERLSADGRYREYLDGCGAVCAFRPVAEAYLSDGDPSADPRVASCDDLAASPTDAQRPEGVPGRAWDALDGHAAAAACSAARAAFPDVPRLAYQEGRALDRLGRYEEARAAYEAGVDLGSMAALNNLATLHENGEGVPPDLPHAFALYTEAAEGGDVLAMTNAARMLEYGRGVDADLAASVAWYKRAAEAGDAFAMTKLVPFYLEGGPGIPQDPEAGFDLFRRAVDGGDPMAMATVAVLIDNGFAEHFPEYTSRDMLLKALGRGEAGAAAVAATSMGEQALDPETVRGLQSDLAERSFYTGAQDGAFNPVFVQAMNAYARSAASQTTE